MDNKIALGVISVFVVLAVIGSALTPMIDAYTTTTTTIENEGAVGLRMDKVTSGDFTLTYGLVGDDFTATNGTDAQIIDDMCIFYADDNVAVWMDDSSVRMVGKDANDQTIDTALSDEATITITKSADGVNITDGTINQTFPVPAWSYVPKSTGAYGFFLNEAEINTGGLDVHYVGSFAGVNCYDSINTYDLPITLDAAITGSTLTGAKWIKAASAADPETELTPLEPGSLTPLDPGVISIDPEPDASIMTVPTPTYTDGDWGYDLITTGYDSTVAKIVSYSGTGGNIVVPSTVGGYPVKEIGKGGSSQAIALNSNISANSTLTIPDGVVKINDWAFQYITNLKGDLIIPDSVEYLGQACFGNTGFNGTLTLGSNINTIGSGAFNVCQFTGTLILPENLENVIGQAFYGNNKLTGSLIIPDKWVNSVGGFQNCSGFTGTLTLSPNLVTLAYNGFMSCQFTGTLIIPETCTNVYGNCFSFCNFDSLVVVGSPEFGNNAMYNNTNLKTVLNLGETEITTTTAGLNADEVRSDIPALGYLATLQYKETVTEDGPVAALLQAIPLIAIIAVVMMAVGVFIAHRME